MLFFLEVTFIAHRMHISIKTLADIWAIWLVSTVANNTVGQKSILMFGYFVKIEVEQIKKIM